MKPAYLSFCPDASQHIFSKQIQYFNLIPYNHKHNQLNQYTLYNGNQFFISLMMTKRVGHKIVGLFSNGIDKKGT